MTQNCAALSGLFVGLPSLPRALPWADLFNPFGAPNKQFRERIGIFSTLRRATETAPEGNWRCILLNLNTACFPTIRIANRSELPKEPKTANQSGGKAPHSKFVKSHMLNRFGVRRFSAALVFHLYRIVENRRLRDAIALFPVG